MLFETDRLICRNFQSDDFEAIHDYASRMEVVRYMLWGPNTIEETRIFMKESIEAIHKKPRRRYELALQDKETGQVVGAVALYLMTHQGGEIGYSIRPKYWGLGYATEASRGLIRYGFEVLNLHRIQATCDVRNKASANVLTKSGMVKEGVMRDHMRLRDGWRSSFLFSILKKDFSSKE
jgi:RimJ/RimL family protein N-acetyltransferase